MTEKRGRRRKLAGPEAPWASELKAKIERRTARLALVGLGYVGLPLAILFAKQFQVYGFDSNRELVKDLRAGRSHIDDTPASAVKSMIGKSFFPTDDASELRPCDFVIVTVPTPLSASKEPDLGPIERAGESIAKNLQTGQFVILESTTYPGTTRDVLIPILEKSGLSAGLDFGVAYSPERVDPGNRNFRTENTPKVVGGINTSCTQLAASLFECVVGRVVVVESCEVAEATKMLENVFRAVNIALVNELTLALDRMGINTWHVIDAASTKPYGFMPFYPGPGIGGHCIPLDPFYMSYRARQFGLVTRFIELSGETNEFMKFHAVNLLAEGLEQLGKRLRNATVVVFGVSYKKDIKDTRESPARKIIAELHRRGCGIKIYDPIAQVIETDVGSFRTEASAERALKDSDAVLILTDHSVFRDLATMDFRRLMRGTPVIVDTRNVIRTPISGSIHVSLGQGRPDGSVVPNRVG